MRTLMTIVLTALLLTACADEPAPTPPPAAPETPAAETPTDTGATDAPADAAEPLIIDVRSQEEWDAGHLPNAVLIPHTEIGAKIGDVTTDKSRQIYLHCRSGGRAGKAKTALEEMGYTNVENVGGYEDALKRFGPDATK